MGAGLPGSGDEQQEAPSRWRGRGEQPQPGVRPRLIQLIFTRASTSGKATQTPAPPRRAFLVGPGSLLAPPFVAPLLSAHRLSHAHTLFDTSTRRAVSSPSSTRPPDLLSDQMATATASVAPPSTSTSSFLLLSRRRFPAAAPAPFRGLVSAPPRRLRIQVALTSEVSSDDVAAEEAAAAPKIGRRVRVTAPLRVYHVVKAPDLDVQGMEGVVKQYVCVWKGKRITANFPFKVEFSLSVEGQPKPVRFFVHLREDEFEFVDDE